MDILDAYHTKYPPEAKSFCRACALDNFCPEHPRVNNFRTLPGGYAEARKDYDDMVFQSPLKSAIDRAVHNSPPPLDDVGDDVFEMLDDKDPNKPSVRQSYAMDNPDKRCEHGMSRNGLACDWCNPIEELTMEYPEDVNPHVVAANFAEGPLLNERQKTHGSFAANAAIGQTLRTIFRKSKGWEVATDRQREALDYVAGKLSRILSGQPGHADHWDDIAGYAKLAANPDLQR